MGNELQTTQNIMPICISKFKGAAVNTAVYAWQLIWNVFLILNSLPRAFSEVNSVSSDMVLIILSSTAYSASSTTRYYPNIPDLRPRKPNKQLTATDGIELCP